MKEHAFIVYCNNMECVTQLSFRTGIFRAIKFCVTFHLVLNKCSFFLFVLLVLNHKKLLLSPGGITIFLGFGRET